MTESEILDQLLIDTSDLSKHMAEQPNLYSRFAFMAAHVDDKFERAKFERDIVEAELSHGIREGLSGKDKPTEKAIFAQVIQDARYQAANEKVLKANLEADVIKGAVEGFRSRAQMLSSIGAMQREEMQQQAFLGTPTASSMDERRKKINDALKNKFLSQTGKKP
jgi:hypothetical protein